MRIAWRAPRARPGGAQQVRQARCAGAPTLGNLLYATLPQTPLYDSVPTRCCPRCCPRCCHRQHAHRHQINVSTRCAGKHALHMPARPLGVVVHFPARRAVKRLALLRRRRPAVAADLSTSHASAPREAAVHQESDVVGAPAGRAAAEHCVARVPSLHEMVGALGPALVEDPALGAAEGRLHGCRRRATRESEACCLLGSIAGDLCT